MSETIYTTYSYVSERGNFITISRPILTDEERAKRMEEIKQAAIKLVLETEKAKQRRLKHKNT